MKKYYLDTSIWIDLFEDRNEPNFAKTEYAIRLIDFVLSNGEIIIYSGIVLSELMSQGYSKYEIKEFWRDLRPYLCFVRPNKYMLGKARDIAIKRNLPKGDVLHAILARENRAILVS